MRIEPGPVECSAMMEIVYICVVQYGSFQPHVATAIKDINFKLSSIKFNLILNTHMARRYRIGQHRSTLY